jgi:hypothetical protein
MLIILFYWVKAGLEVKTKKIRYTFMFHHQNSRQKSQNHSKKKTANKSFKNVIGQIFGNDSKKSKLHSWRTEDVIKELMTLQGLTNNQTDFVQYCCYALVSMVIFKVLDFWHFAHNTMPLPYWKHCLKLFSGSLSVLSSHCSEYQMSIVDVLKLVK